MAVVVPDRIELGRVYRDVTHGIEGVAMSRTKFVAGCARVLLEWVKDGEIKQAVFDETQLVEEVKEMVVEEKVVEEKVLPQASRDRGGPGDPLPRASILSR